MVNCIYFEHKNINKHFYLFNIFNQKKRKKKKPSWKRYLYSIIQIFKPASLSMFSFHKKTQTIQFKLDF